MSLLTVPPLQAENGSIQALTESGSAASPGAWVEIAPFGLRRSAGSIYDPVGDRIILHGGVAGAGTVSDVWEYRFGASRSWKQVAAAGSPTLRSHVAVYDSQRRQMITLGGNAGMDVFPAWALPLDQPDRWISLGRLTGYGAQRSGGVAIYDPIGDRVIHFGGVDETARYYDEVFILQLGAQPTFSIVGPRFAGRRPSGIAGSAAVYDPKHHRMVLLTMDISSFPYRSSVWELRLEGELTWREILVSGDLPPAAGAASAVIDTATQQVLLYGAESQGDSGANVWILSLTDSTWRRYTPPGDAPARRRAHGAIWHPARREMLVFGGAPPYGSVEPVPNDIHALAVSPDLMWRLEAVTPDHPRPDARRDLRWVHDSRENRLITLPGVAGYENRNRCDPYVRAEEVYNTSLWALDLDVSPVSWMTLPSAGMRPDGRKGMGAAYDSRRHRIIALGGTWEHFVACVHGGPDYEEVSDQHLWIYDLAALSWGKGLVEGPAPPGWPFPVVEYDRQGDRLIAMGGPILYPKASTTELLDLWTLPLSEAPLRWRRHGSAPPASGLSWETEGIRGVLDAKRNRILVLADSELWSVSLDAAPQWTRLTGLVGTFPMRRGQALMLDTVRDRLVLHGGGAPSRADVWALALGPLGRWTLLEHESSSSPARAGHVVWYDDVVDRLLMFGGGGPAEDPSSKLWDFTWGDSVRHLRASLGPGALPRTSRGKHPMTVFGREDVDLSLVEPGGLTLAGASLSWGAGSNEPAGLRDVDGDGIVDLHAFVEVGDIEWSEDFDRLRLDGRLADGTRVRSDVTTRSRGAASRSSAEGELHVGVQWQTGPDRRRLQVSFDAADVGDLGVSLFDLQGRRIVSWRGVAMPGRMTVTLDLAAPLPPGLYFGRVEKGSGVAIRKVLIGP